MLTEQQGQTLVRLARQTIAQHLGLAGDDDAERHGREDQALRQKQGVFVTLHKHGALRGCIGSLTGTEAIIDGVRRQAANAAFHDHRFQAVTVDELQDLVIEVSVLSPPQSLPYTSGGELLSLLHPGKDGVILRDRSGAGATFLPQVWEQLPQPEQFLGHLCRKAGLTETAWQSGDLAIQTYRVQHFEESR